MAKFSSFSACLRKTTIKYIQYLSGEAYCWLNTLILTEAQKYELLKTQNRVITDFQLIKLWIKYGFKNFKIFKTDNNNSKFHILSDNESNSLESIKFIIENEGLFGSYKQVGKDAMYSITNVTRKDCIGYESASGALGSYSTKMVKESLIVPYSCTEEQQDMIRTAIPDRFILFDQPGIRVSHAPLKFLTEFLDESMLRMDVEDKSVKVIGPKFDKKEVDSFKRAEKVHFCTKKPVIYDNARLVSSSNSLKRKIHSTIAVLEEYEKQIDILRKEQTKKAGSDYVKQISAQIMDLVKLQSNLRIDLVDYQEEYDAINSKENYTSGKVCNVGAEKCTEKCDVMISMHSIYDIDLSKLVSVAEKGGALEVFATVILPFGLLYADSYYSQELDVRFYRRKNGFMMVHGGDLSNGYVHDKAIQIMNLMKSSFVRGDKKLWSYEIVDSIAEICKLRFTVADKGMKVVRKLMPKKFDNYSMIMNPLEFFGPRMKLVPLIVEKNKLESAIKYVKRAKSTKDIIEDTYSTVQALFMRVVVGNTELQAGGMVDSNMEDAIVLAAIIEGRIRKHLLGTAYKKCISDATLFSAIVEKIKSAFSDVIESLVPKSWYDFFTKTAAQRYIEYRVDFSELYMYSDLSTHRSISSFMGTFVESYKDGWSGAEEAIDYVKKNWAGREVRYKFYEKLPTLHDIIRKNDLVFEKFESSEEKEKLSILKMLMNKDIAGLSSEELMKKKINKLRSVVDHSIKRYQIEIENEIEREEENEWNNHNEAMADMYSQLEQLKKPEIDEVDILPVNGEDVKNFVDNDDMNSIVPFDKHDSRSTEHIDHKMDDLSQAALRFNSNRAAKIKAGIPMSKREVEMLVQKFTKKGRVSNPVISREEALDYLDILKGEYAVDESAAEVEILKNLKKSMLKLIKETIKNNSIDTLDDKQLEVINGYAGSGKTRRILEEFSVERDSYVSPLAEILFKFNADLKKDKPKDMEISQRNDMLKTFDKISELKRNGRILFIDEASKLTIGYLLFLILYTNYEKYVIVGDVEQSKFYDPTGMSGVKMFVNLVPDDAVARYYYTFRFGPTVAAFNNVTFNYPVFSLKSTDTKIIYNSLEDFNSSIEGTNISVSKETKAWMKDDLATTTALTSVSSQGLTVPRVNFVLRANDIHAAINFRSNGIVAATRAQDTLALYVDYVSKRTKAVKNFEILRENFSNVFDIVLPNEADF